MRHGRLRFAYGSIELWSFRMPNRRLVHGGWPIRKISSEASRRLSRRASARRTSSRISRLDSMRNAPRTVAPERAARSPPSRGAAEAWTLFWAEQSPGSRCMARSPEICALVDAHWSTFASTLPPQTRVLDLGCGGGAVARALHAAEPRCRSPASTWPKFRPRTNRGSSFCRTSRWNRRRSPTARSELQSASSAMNMATSPRSPPRWRESLRLGRPSHS